MPFTKYLIQAIKEALPQDRSIAPYLANLLSLGKEAVYRRIRSEVTFSFDEVVLIANDLDISLDILLGKISTQKAVFDLNVLDHKNVITDYAEIMGYYTKIFQMMSRSTNSMLQSALNVIPYSFFLNYELISKFQLYKWLYQVLPVEDNRPMSEFELPSYMKDTFRNMITQNHSVKKTTFILDRNVFISFAEDITYFAQLKLINDQEKQQLKNELLELIASIEMASIVGKYNTGNEVLFYLSNINFEASYTVLESDNFQMVHLRVFSINIIASQNLRICEIQKKWVESLKGHSTLITGSG